MTEVTRFPHYHHRENVVTNHVMVMLRTIYEHSPRLLKGLLQSLCGAEIRIGPDFSQQIAGSNSIPDGLILQEPLSVFIETKLGDTQNPAQLQAHMESIASRRTGGNHLIALSAGDGSSALPAAVVHRAEELQIKLVSTTFEALVGAIGALDVEHIPLRTMIEEFTSFIAAQGLLPRNGRTLVAVLTGDSWQDNAAFGVYYEPAASHPAARSSKWGRAAFMGLYHDRQVSHVGRIVATVLAWTDASGALVFTSEAGPAPDADQQNAIRGAIAAGQSYFPNFDKQEHRYYLVDKFVATTFRKSTAYGIQGHRYFDIGEKSSKRVPAGATGETVADLLDGCTFI